MASSEPTQFTSPIYTPPTLVGDNMASSRFMPSTTLPLDLNAGGSSLRSQVTLHSELAHRLQQHTEYSHLEIEGVTQLTNEKGTYWKVAFKGLTGKNRRFVCSLEVVEGTACSEICTSSRGINRHFSAKKHVGSHTKMFYCDHERYPCGKFFARQDSMRRHVNDAKHGPSSKRKQ